MDDYERQQALLAKIRTRFCGGVASRLAAAIGKDPSYVNRLFYPREKKGAKGIGPEIQLATKNVFDLPRGFWDMHPDEVWPDEPSGVVIHGDFGAKKSALPLRITQYKTGGAMGDGLVLREQPGVIQGWDVSPEWVQKNLPYHTSFENLSIVTGFGDSMLGMFHPGDPLLIDHGINICDVDGVYFFRVDGEGFIKRLQRIPGEGILVISENQKYRDWTIKPSMDFAVLGKVLQVWKSEKL
ncbi:S24 family peptidase [Diaphorobacter sp. HDW4B]|nr:S24 family peptidase [Diaphorobacter sp. HDW4B]